MAAVPRRRKKGTLQVARGRPRRNLHAIFFLESKTRFCKALTKPLLRVGWVSFIRLELYFHASGCYLGFAPRDYLCCRFCQEAVAAVMEAVAAVMVAVGRVWWWLQVYSSSSSGAYATLRMVMDGSWAPSEYLPDVAADGAFVGVVAFGLVRCAAALIRSNFPRQV